MQIMAGELFLAGGEVDGFMLWERDKKFPEMTQSENLLSP